MPDAARTATSRGWACATTRSTPARGVLLDAADRAPAGRAADRARLASLRQRWSDRRCPAETRARPC